MDPELKMTLVPIGLVRTPFVHLWEAPEQGREVGSQGEILIDPPYLEGIEDVRPGDRLWVLLWFHKAQRDVLKVHPRGDHSRTRRGVFSTRSPHRPNPIGLCQVEVLERKGAWMRVSGLDALDGTPVIDIKPYIRSLDG